MLNLVMQNNCILIMNYKTARSNIDYYAIP